MVEKSERLQDVIYRRITSKRLRSKIHAVMSVEKIVTLKEMEYVIRYDRDQRRMRRFASGQ